MKEEIQDLGKVAVLADLTMTGFGVNKHDKEASDELTTRKHEALDRCRTSPLYSKKNAQDVLFPDRSMDKRSPDAARRQHGET
jgi:hypothetical protein